VGEGERERVGERGDRNGLLEEREELCLCPVALAANEGAGGARSMRVSGKSGSVCGSLLVWFWGLGLGSVWGYTSDV